MKHFLVIIAMLLFYQTQAQDDKWYIKNSNFLTSPQTYTSTPPADLESCYILDVTHPDLSFNGRNDIFIIYENGNYFNSRYIDRAFWSDYGTSLRKNYYIPPNSLGTPYSDISHLYFTNIYEDDEEPSAMIQNNSIVLLNNNSYQEFRDFGASSLITNPTEAITANHSTALGKDITLILENVWMLTACNYSLCFNTFVDRSGNTVTPPSSFVITGADIFGPVGAPDAFMASGGAPAAGPSSSPLTPKNDTITGDTCIHNLTFNSSQGFTYVNLHIPEDPSLAMKGKSLIFTLNPAVGSCPSYSLRDTIRDSHDPNYVELLCVSSSPLDTTSTIQYKAYCMNDGEESQPNPSIELTFPYTINASDIEVTRAKIRNSIPFTGFNRYAPTVTMDPIIPNRAIFSFSGLLESCPGGTLREECEAWVEFCVTVDTASVDVLTADLEPRDRNTNFDTTEYPIDKYRGLPCCRAWESIEDSIPNNSQFLRDNTESANASSAISSTKKGNSNSIRELRNFNDPGPPCTRQNRDCDCSPDLPRCLWFSIICNNEIQWHKIVCILLLLILILYLLRKKGGNGEAKIPT